MFSAALDLSLIIILAKNNLTPTSNSVVTLCNRLVGAAFFMTLASTLLTTVLIAFRIYSASRNSALTSARTPYKKVIDIIVQSALLYSLASLALAITIVIPWTASNFEVLNRAEDYVSCFTPFIAVSQSHSFQGGVIDALNLNIRECHRR